jgi:hypothetical protein
MEFVGVESAVRESLEPMAGDPAAPDTVSIETPRLVQLGRCRLTSKPNPYFHPFEESVPSLL